MFREVTRKQQQLPQARCRELLKQEVRGVLAVNGDDGYPYALPMNFYYDEAEHRVYFHSGKSGYKLEALERSDKVCFCVCDRGRRREGHWSLDFCSVILFGRLRRVEDWPEERMVAFSRRFTDDMDYIRGEIESFRSSTTLLCLQIEHMTGKLVNEA